MYPFNFKHVNCQTQEERAEQSRQYLETSKHRRVVLARLYAVATDCDRLGMSGSGEQIELMIGGLDSDRGELADRIGSCYQSHLDLLEEHEEEEDECLADYSDWDGISSALESAWAQAVLFVVLKEVLS